MAYVSDESGSHEAYIAPFPGPGGKWQISSAGVSAGPFWRGKEIIYVDMRDMPVSVEVKAEGATIQAGAPKPLSLLPHATNGDITPDGQRFILEIPSEADEERPVTLVFNWAGGPGR